MRKLISIECLSYSIPYGETLLNNINLDIHEGELLGILGHNGSGKTTLLDVILGNKRASAGQIKVLDEDPHAIRRQNKNQIVYLSQDVSIKGDLTIGEFLKFHSSFYPNYSIADESYLLEAFNLNKSLKVGALSTGQQKKVQVIAGFSALPKLVIIDEITAVLDPETRDIFFRELQNLRERHQTSILLATNLAEDLVDRASNVLFIEDRKAVLHRPEDIMKLFNIGQVA